MKLEELFESIDTEIEDFLDELLEGAKPIWKTSGSGKNKKVKRGFRCMTGKKRGRIVDNPATCGGPVNIKKRMAMRKLMLQKGKRLRKKAQRMKKKNPASRRLKMLNKKAGR